MNDELNLTQLMSLIKDHFSYAEICKLSPSARVKYNQLLETFKTVNGSNASTPEKGKALEDLVAYLLEISGNIFTVVTNVKTSTNEIDEIIKLNQKGKALLSNGLLPPRLSHFLGECKNYQTNVGVTYIGKFYSLLQTTCLTTGILFTYHGVTGSDWSDGTGLIKKMYLQRENEDNRVAIIVFNLEDFEAISDGQNFLQIIEDKLDALQYDTGVSSFISSHPAETLLQSAQF